MLDLSRVRSEADKFRKELIIAQSLINELRKENDILNRELTNFQSTKQRYKENYEEKTKQVESTKGVISNLESDKQEIMEENNSIKQEYELVCRDLDIEVQKSRKLEIEVFHYSKKIQECETKLQNKSLLQSKLLEVKKNYDLLKDDFDVLVKKLNKTDFDNKHYIEENDALTRKYNEMEDKLDDFERKIIIEKKKALKTNEDLDNRILELEKQKNMLSKLLKEKEADNPRYDEKIEKLEKEVHLYKGSNDSIYIEYEAYKKNQLEKAKLHDKAIKDYQNQVFNLKEQIDNATEIKSTQAKEITKLKLEIDKLEFDKSKLITENDGFKVVKDELVDQYEKSIKTAKQVEGENSLIKHEKDVYSNELKFWREKYDKDLNSKIGELKQIYTDLSNSKSDVNNLKNLLNESNNMIIDKEDEVQKLEIKLKRQDTEITQLNQRDLDKNQKLDLYNEKNRKLEKYLLDKDILISNLEQKTFLFEDLEKRCNNLDSLLSEAEFKVKSLEKEQKNYKNEYSSLIGVLTDYENNLVNKNIEANLNINFLRDTRDLKSPTDKLNINLLESKDIEGVDQLNDLRASSGTINPNQQNNQSLFTVSEKFEKKLLKILQDSEDMYQRLDYLKSENSKMIKREEAMVEQLNQIKNSELDKVNKINVYQQL